MVPGPYGADRPPPAPWWTWRESGIGSKVPGPLAARPTPGLDPSTGRASEPQLGADRRVGGLDRARRVDLADGAVRVLQPVPGQDAHGRRAGRHADLEEAGDGCSR